MTRRVAVPVVEVVSLTNLKAMSKSRHGFNASSRAQVRYYYARSVTRAEIRSALLTSYHDFQPWNGNVQAIWLTFFDAFFVSAFTAAAWVFFVAFATAGAAFFAILYINRTDNGCARGYRLCVHSTAFAAEQHFRHAPY